MRQQQPATCLLQSEFVLHLGDRKEQHTSIHSALRTCNTHTSAVSKEVEDLHRANVTCLWKTLQDMKSPWLQGLSDVHLTKKIEPARGSRENEKDKA